MIQPPESIDPPGRWARTFRAILDQRAIPVYFPSMRTTTKGVASAILAFCLWGLTPLYWARLDHVPALEVILHRIWWSFPILWVVILARRGRRTRNIDPVVGSTTDTSRIIPSWRVFIRTTIAGALVTINWLAYVWAVTHGRTLEASLGYYINPLVSVALGTLVLRERLDRLQGAAVIIAAAGVVFLTVRVGTVPWISLILASSFGVYGLIKKQVPVGATHSLALELIPIAPPALIAILVSMFRGTSSFIGVNVETTVLLIVAGAVTVVPLILFGYATRCIRLSDVGFIQYIAPTSMLLLGVFVFREVLDVKRLPGFIFVWIALILYSVSSMTRRNGESA